MTAPVRESAAELVEHAQQAERQGRRAEARELYEAVLHGSTLPDGIRATDLLRWIGRSHLADANYPAALDCATVALAAAVSADDAVAAGHALNLQAVVHTQQGRLDVAEGIYHDVRARALAAGELALGAMASQNLGVIANIRGDYDVALGHYEVSLRDYRSLGLTREVCATLNNLGKLHTDLEHWDAAERSYDEAVQISTVLGDLSSRILLEVNLAELWLARGELERARDACDRARELSIQLDDPRAEGETEKLYGIVARERGDHARAERHFLEAERIATGRQSVLLLAEVAREKAELHRRQGRNRDLLQSLNRAHRLFEQLRASRDLADIDRRTRRLEDDFLDVVRKWGESIESKDRYTQGHCERVAEIACALAAASGLDPDSLFWFRIGALLHDVGKLVVPPEVLNKPGKLTDEEWTLVRRHPSAGVEMLADIEFPWDVRPLVESHHERWDGRGYPNGAAGEDIPLAARILCIADVFDALTSERSYKRALSIDDAMAVMRAEVGRQFDPELFATFDRLMATERPAAAEPRLLAPEATRPADAPPHRDAAPATDDPLWPAHHVDDLTGLPLRRAYAERAVDMLAAASEDAPVSLLVLDVDHFKLVNDTYGHLQGDAVLRGVAALVRDAAGLDGFAARYAGDEFVVLLPMTELDAAVAIAERLCAAARATPFAIRDGGELSCTLSIGAASAPGDGRDAESLFAAADRALYVAKRRGRDGAATDAEGANAAPQPHFERFVGRQEELARLTRLLESATAGEARLAAIVGEAGVGKSTLVRQLAPEVRLRGGMTVLGRCLEADVRPPYGPWAEIITEIQATMAPPPRDWRELPRLVPSLGESPPPEQAGNKYALYEEIADYVRLASEARPLVVVLDDMQWADSASWDTLEHVLSRLDRDRVLLCLTIRAEDSKAEVIERRRRLSRDERFHELRLSRFTREELAQWTELALRQRDVGGDLPGYLYEHTEGNALFLVQVLRTMVEEGAIRFSDGRWEWSASSALSLPVAVSELIARRIDRLSADSRTVLTTAAVIGRTFDVDLALAAGAGTEDELLDAIDEAVSAAVLEPSSRDDDRYAFAHTLLVDAIRRSAQPRRLRRIHERVAEALEARSPASVAEIARHYDGSGNAPKAYAWATRAGQAAMGVHAHDDAKAFLVMAQRHAASAAERCQIGQLLAAVAEGAGRYMEAQTLVEALLATHDAELSGEEALRVRRARQRLRSLQGHPSAATLEACRLLLAEAEGLGLEAERVALLTMISQAYMRLGDWRAAERIARDCVAMADTMGDRALRADALTRLGTTLVETRPAEAAELHRAALALYTEIDHRYGQARCNINLGSSLLLLHDSDAAREAYEHALAIGRAAHAPEVAGVASLNLGVLILKEGLEDEARGRFEEALRLFVAIRHSAYELATRYNMSHLARQRGDFAAALELYHACAELASRIGQADVELGAKAGAGLSALALGDEGAATAAQRDIEARGRTDWWFQGRELVETLAVRVAIAHGRVSEAAGRFEAALAFARRSNDAFALGWLVAECAPPLDAAGVPMRDIVERCRPSAPVSPRSALAIRYAEVAERLAS